jgi:serine/threonine protein kinase
LSGFGNAAWLDPGDMLFEKVGTSAFLAPEMWSVGYTFPVDVWALGITTFVLVAGELPFRGTEQICKTGCPVLNLPQDASKDCARFISSCLAHDPCERITAADALLHPWFSAEQAVFIDNARSCDFPASLLERYDVKDDKPIAFGRFSKVFTSQCRCTGKKYAIKQLGFVGTPRKIAHEIAMMKLCGHHRNVVTCYGVYLGATSINIIVDMFRGGDLIDGLFVHCAAARGRIPDSLLARMCHQMVSALRHVHQLHIIHRDMKGENFLLSMKDITDSQCRIAISDFGNATWLDPGQELCAKAGTSAFWAPEVWSCKYNFQADVWALALTVFILLAGDLPFTGKDEICRPGGPRYEFPTGTSAKCKDFIQLCLTEDPRKRLTIEEAYSHLWFCTDQPQS